MNRVKLICTLIILSTAVIALPVSVYADQPFTIERVSTDSAGGQASSAGYAGYYPVFSPNSSYSVFSSDATNLVAGDTNGVDDVFMKDLQTGSIIRISTDSTGVQGNGNSGYFNASSISTDNRYVVFESAATNLVAGDTNGRSDIFLKDIQTNITTRVSTSSTGTQAGNDSFNPSISANGRYVAFSSLATNLVAGDTNSVQDVFLKDLQTGVTTRVSTDSSGGQSNAISVTVSMSDDGELIVFESSATNLVAGDTNGRYDIFLKSVQTGVTTRVSTDSSGAQGNNDSIYASISANGRYVAFSSLATNLVAGDTNSAQDVFLKDLQTGVTTRVSTDSSGAEGGSNSLNSYAYRSISADGRFVTFISYSNTLVSGGTVANRQHVYIKDLQTNETILISRNVLGNQGDNDSGVYGITISPDGQNILFESNATNLVLGDTNSAADLFLTTNPLWDAPLLPQNPEEPVSNPADEDNTDELAETGSKPTISIVLGSLIMIISFVSIPKPIYRKNKKYKLY